MRRSGHRWNHKRMYRVYGLLKLNKRRKGEKRLPTRIKQPLIGQEMVNNSWSMDFMSDSMTGNRSFRMFNVMDDCSREALAIEIDTSLSAKRITRVPDRILATPGKPKSLRVDNGPEFTFTDFCLWCRENIILRYIQPGKSMQNGYVERFN